MKILLTGSSGQLGKAIVNKKPNNYKLLTPKRAELDLVKQPKLSRICGISQTRFDYKFWCFHKC